MFGKEKFIPSIPARAPLERLVESVLNGFTTEDYPEGVGPELTRKFSRFDARGTRVVVLGGGTGLSTIVGGDSQVPAWLFDPFVGLKQEFPRLDAVVVTTDDGGSTGRLLKQLPMIGIGDLRKSCLSLILSDNLERVYGLHKDQARAVVPTIQRIFNYRFPEKTRGSSIIKDPLLAAPPGMRKRCPEKLAASLRALGGYILPEGTGPTINPAGHCLGNLLLTAAVFKAAAGRTDLPPNLTAIRAGLDEVARVIGMTPGCLHPATAAPGQLSFRYTNGVEVYGQKKAACSQRGFPIEKVSSEFTENPGVSSSVRRAIRSADLIIYAPGSLYSSMLPLLQLPVIVSAIRANRKALKILAANFWIQEGETDISPGNARCGYLVSEIIEAYDHNIPGGMKGLFDIILSANLEHIPGDFLRNYALEGKIPIYLDRPRVEALGFQAVEAMLFSPDQLKTSSMIHHDAENFARAIKTILFARRFFPEMVNISRPNKVPPPPPRRAAPARRSPLLCEYLSAIEDTLNGKNFRPKKLKKVMVDLSWENRDISLPHLKYFSGVRVVSAEKWDRSTAWDNVLGYYDPADRYIKIHEQLMSEPARLRGDLLTSLGESLLGRYIETYRWIEGASGEEYGARTFEIHLRSPSRRECFLSDVQLRTYLKLARMIPEPGDPRIYRITINNNEGFLTPGLLFGLLYAWYLNNNYGGVMEYEMSLLRWRPGSLIPYQAQERARKQALVTFFRTEIFGHPDVI